MSIDYDARIGRQSEHPVAQQAPQRHEPTQDEWDAWEYLRAHPENLQHGTSDVDAEITYYRLNPPRDDFCDQNTVFVGVCGAYAHDFPGPRPDEASELVLLGLRGSTGKRLINVLIEPDEARKLARSLRRAAKQIH